MTNLRIIFSQPWFLLLLIPAFALTFFLHFKISKRYRRTRNRIVSMVVHFVAVTLSIFVLSGIQFHYEIPNLETEVILLVDVSDGITNRYQNVREDCISNIVYGMENDGTTPSRWCKMEYLEAKGKWKDWVAGSTD